MITVWRVVGRRFADPPYDPFDGKGAELDGGRWNSPGVPVVYAAGYRALAILEVLVHTGGLDTLLDRVVFPVEVPPDLVHSIDPSTLPPGWSDPDAPTALRAVGDAWARGLVSAVLRVPSAVVTGESNYVLNPRHPDFPKLAIGPRQPLPIDPRLLPKRPPG